MPDDERIHPSGRVQAAHMNGVREVRCPTCRQPTVYAADNPWRPFCSARCRGMDLGAWASEDYRVATTPPADADPDAAPLTSPDRDP